MLAKHHAYICNSELSKQECLSIFSSEEGISDISFFESHSFSIDDARKLIKEAYLQPNVGKYKVIVVRTQSINLESQQALLKILEEPPLSTIFFFVLPKQNNLIPTLLSRFLFYDSRKETASDTNESDNTVLKTFVELSYKERMDLIADRLKKDDKDWLLEIKKGLANKMSLIGSRLKPNVLNRLNMIVMNLDTRGASNKMLLDELALTLSKGDLVVKK